MTNWLEKSRRLLQIDSVFGDEVFALLEFSGDEGISKPFKFYLKLIAAEMDIAPDQIIGTALSVKLRTGYDEYRYFHGIVNRFQSDKVEHGIRYYDAEIVPWLHLLNYTSDCRIFQHKTVPVIAKEIIREYTDMLVDMSGLTKVYQQREYCVQYRETALQFIERLFEEEGIFYYFKHEEDKHTLMLADSNSACKEADPAIVMLDKGSYKAHGITEWHKQNTFYAGKFEQNDFNYKTADRDLHTQQQSHPKLTHAQKFGLYDYPGSYEATGEGKKVTQHRFEAQEAGYEQYNGASNYVNFSPAQRITLTEAPVESDNKAYILNTVSHHAADHTYLGTGGSGSSQQYFNSFACTPAAVPIRIKHYHEKPAIYGAQTAVVTGGEGEEICTDEYGRVNVQFHWDRKGKKNEYSSCRIRVAQIWAGRNWGAVFVPRVGHEVIVQFLDGDPDRPIITGSVYNSSNKMPYQYPLDKTKSGIKSHSSKGGGDADANELYFEDKAGAEEIHIHAQKDFNQIIKHNSTQTIGNNLTVQIVKQGVIESQETIKICAQKSIELTVENNTVLLNAQGIFLNGVDVKIQDA